MTQEDLKRLGITKDKDFHSIVFILLCVIGFLGALLVGGCLKEARAEVDLSIIKQIESNGNPTVISRTGAIGLYQIMPCVLKEYNQFHKVNLQRNDLFNPLVNERIAKWYLTKRIPQMLNYYKLPISNELVIRAYNSGIGNVVKGRFPLETKNYLIKYNRLARSK